MQLYLNIDREPLLRFNTELIAKCVCEDAQNEPESLRNSLIY